MTDKQFEKLMNHCAKAWNKYHSLLQECEEEYQRRYGKLPSDVDDDGWIDALGGGGGVARSLTAEEVKEGAIICGLERNLQIISP